MASFEKTKFDRPDIAHIKCVCSDPEFYTQASWILGAISKEDDNHISNGRIEGKIRLVIGDKNVRILPDAVVEDIQALVDDFEIKFEDVISYLNGYFEKYVDKPNAVYSSPSKFDVDEPPLLTIRIERNATKREVLNLLKSFDMMMQYVYGERVKKDKAPENYKLVYAIFRARKKGLKFKEIFERYSSKELELYDGPTQLGSQEKLKQYYYKYRQKSTT